MKVLVADDELTSRKLLEKSLVKFGYEVILVSPDLSKLGQQIEFL